MVRRAKRKSHASSRHNGRVDGGDERNSGSNASVFDTGPDLYALLNVPRHATVDDIKAAYTRLARVFHPDKLKTLSAEDQEARAEAQSMFILVDRAYKVLSGPTERAVYDLYGWEGLDALHAIGAEDARNYSAIIKAGKNKSRTSPPRSWPDSNDPRRAQWLRDSKFQALGLVDERGARLRDRLLPRIELERAVDREARFNVRGAIQVGVDGRGLVGRAFEPLSEYDAYEAYDDGGLGMPELKFSSPSVTSCVVQQSVDAALSRNDSLSLAAYLMTSEGKGMHHLTLGHEHQFNEYTSSETTLQNTANDPLAVWLKVNRVLSPFTKGSLELSLRDGFTSTGLNVSGTRRLTDSVTGALQVGFGSESGVSVQLNRRSEFGEPRFRSKREQEQAYYQSFYQTPDINEDEIDRDASAVGGGANDRQTEDSADDLRRLQKYTSNGSAVLYFSDNGLGVQMNWGRSLSAKSRASLGLKLSTSAVELDLASTRALSAHSKGNVKLTVGLMGVKLTFKYERGGIRYAVPLKLSSSLSFGAALVGGAVPAIINWAVGKALSSRLLRRRARDNYEIAREMLAAREQAKVQLRIMRFAAQTKRESAKGEKGLLILRARYGTRLGDKCDWRPVAMPEISEYVGAQQQSRPRRPSDWDYDDEPDAETERSGSDTAASQEDDGNMAFSEQNDQDVYCQHPPNIDVTDQLQFLAQETSLELHGGVSKAQLLGFYDPCADSDFEEPQLYVRYVLGSWVFEIICDDLEPLQLPSPRATLIGNLLTNPSADFADR